MIILVFLSSELALQIPPKILSLEAVHLEYYKKTENWFHEYKTDNTQD
jgi:hypothetical protein